MQSNPMTKSLLLAVAVAFSAPAIAHDGHDHGLPAPELPATTQPRAIATSESYEVVAVPNGRQLLIYVDRFADNSPVTKADLTVTVGATEIAAAAMPDGVFRLESNQLLLPGKHDLIFALKEGPNSDLLITSLEVPAAAPAGVQKTGPLSWVSPAWITLAVSRLTLPLIGMIGGGLLGVVLLALLVRRRRRATTIKVPAAEAEEPNAGVAQTGVTRLRPKSGGPAAAAAILLLLAAPLPKALAHGDEDHGAAQQPVAFVGDAPRRLPDASVYLPKASQRLLEVRTLQTTETSTQPRRSFVGRVIADPDRFGVVQSTLGGRITPLPAGLPKLGQAVKAGEVLGHVAPYIAAIDRSDAAQTAGDLDLQTALAETRLERAKRLFAVNAGTGVQVEERQIELEGLKKRRAAIAISTTKPEPLVAPIDGVIAAAKVVAGQVVESKDILYEIIDPSSLWVEAFAFDQSVPQAYSEASATVQDGSSFKLDFIGRSRALRQQSTVLQFAIENPPASLSVGTPVTVLVEEGEPVTGIVLPRTAIVRAGNGEDVVWQHKDPERFVATPVKASSFDGERMLVERGLKAGERIVVEGAELINQVR